MAADLRLVPDTAQRHPGERAAHRPRHRLPQRGLPHSGRAHQRQYGTAATTTDHPQPALGAPLAHRQVLDDPVLHIVQPGVVGLQHRPGSAKVVAVLGADVPRQVEHGIQPGTDPAHLGRLLSGPLQLVHLGQRRFAYGLGQPGSLHAGAVVLLLVGRLAGQFGQFLADRGQLLPQQELPLLAFHAFLDVLVDALGHLKLGQVLPGPLDQPGQPLRRVGRLQQPDLLFPAEVRRVAGQVGQGGGALHLLQRIDHLPGPALLQQGGQQGPVLAGHRIQRRIRLGLDHLGRLYPQRRARSGRTGTDRDPADGADHRAAPTAGEPADLLHHTERAGRGILPVHPRHQQHPCPAAVVVGSFAGRRRVAVARRVRPGPVLGLCLGLCLRLGSLDRQPRLGLVQRDRHGHAGQRDQFVKWQDWQGQGLTHVEPPRLS